MKTQKTNQIPTTSGFNNDDLLQIFSTARRRQKKRWPRVIDKYILNKRLKKKARVLLSRVGRAPFNERDVVEIYDYFHVEVFKRIRNRWGRTKRKVGGRGEGRRRRKRERRLESGGRGARFSMRETAEESWRTFDDFDDGVRGP